MRRNLFLAEVYLWSSPAHCLLSNCLYRTWTGTSAKIMQSSEQYCEKRLYLCLSTTPWRHKREWRYSSTHS